MTTTKTTTKITLKDQHTGRPLKMDLVPEKLDSGDETAYWARLTQEQCDTIRTLIPNLPKHFCQADDDQGGQVSFHYLPA